MLNSLTSNVSQCREERKRVSHVFGRHERPLPQFVANFKETPIDTVIAGDWAIDAVHTQVAMPDYGDRLFDPGRFEIGRISEFKRLGP